MHACLTQHTLLEYHVCVTFGTSAYMMAQLAAGASFNAAVQDAVSVVSSCCSTQLEQAAAAAAPVL
jgi:hypothetical protein